MGIDTRSSLIWKIHVADAFEAYKYILFCSVRVREAQLMPLSDRLFSRSMHTYLGRQARVKWRVPRHELVKFLGPGQVGSLHAWCLVLGTVVIAMLELWGKQACRMWC